MKNEGDKEAGLNIVPVVIGVIVAVLVGWGGYSVISGWVNNATSQVQAHVLSAVRDDDVGVPGSKESVSRIVAEMEIVFPYGMAPDSIGELSVRDDSETVVDVNWGPNDPEKVDVEGRSMTKLIVRQAFFPIDFKQGRLWNKTRFLCILKMPPVTNGNKDK